MILPLKIHHKQHCTNMKTATPPWIEKYITDFKTLQLNGEDYTYAIINGDLSRDRDAPATFAIFIYGVLAVSETYPEEYRELGLIHEILESFQEPSDHVCVHTLKLELEIAKEKGFDMRKYIEFRTGFFKGLIDYYEAHPQMQANRILEKLKLSYDHLLNLNP